ncbi:MAG: response regulator [Bacillota bacterium]
MSLCVKGYMESVLIVANQEKSVYPLVEILIQHSYSQIVTATSCADARKKMQERHFDLAIINAPMTSEYGDVLAQELAQKCNSQVIIIVREADYNKATAKLENYGIFTISKPINKTVLFGALKLVEAASTRLKKLEEENNKLARQIDEMRLISRAKCLLIQYLRVSEQEAHKYIEKQAMDQRLTRAIVARNILKTYDK